MPDPTDALRLVPVEPTPEIIRAMCIAVENGEFMDPADPAWVDSYDAWIPAVKAAWKDALAAAPASPLPGGGDEALIAELKEARAVLKPFGVYYDINDLDERLADDTIEVPVGDLRLARAFLARNGKGEG